MSWTATIIDLRPLATGQEVVAVLSNGVDQKFQQSYQTDGTLANLLPLVRATVASRDALAVKSDLSVGLTLDLAQADPALLGVKP